MHNNDIASFYIANEEVLTEKKLMNIIDALDEGGFTTANWRRLGLRLGLRNDDLKTIEYDHRNDAVRCLEECLVQWLKTGEATYTGLAGALEMMKENAAANYISTSEW